MAKNVEKLEFLCIAGGNVNSIATMEKSTTVPQKMKDKITMHVPSHFSHVKTLCDPIDYSLPGSSVHGDSKGNTGVGCQVVPLQGIFLTERSNSHSLSLQHWQMGSSPLTPHTIQQSPSGYTPKWTESRDWNRYLYVYINSSIIHKNQKMVTTQVSSDEQC